MYCEENVINLVGFSKFFSLRPAHVCLVNQLPQTVCVCKYHENVKLLLEPLNNIKSTLPSTCKDFVSAVYTEESEMCMFGKCECCTEKFNFTFDVLFEHYKTQISWYQWESVNQRIVKEKKAGTVEDCVNVLKQLTSNFLFHAYVKRQQSLFFEQTKSSLNKNTVAIQVDFSENFTFKQQNEIQSAHWANNQVTIFTAYVWLPNNTGLSIVFVSDYLEHDKYAVYTCLHRLVMLIKA